MTDLNLDAIEARANAAMLSPTGQQYDAGVVLSTDVPALVAEVRSLRTHLAHAAEVEAALTSDLLAAHVEVEQLRVTRATDRNRGMTDLDLDAIEARANAARNTPGVTVVNGEVHATGRGANAEFMAHAVTDVPALVAALREARAEVADLRRFCAEWSTLEAERDEARAEVERLRLDAGKRLSWAIFAVRDHDAYAQPFVLMRDTDVSGVSGTGVVADGVAFPDGTVALRWRGGNPTSVVFHDNGVESVEAIHGHGGATRLVWLAEDLETTAEVAATYDERDETWDQDDLRRLGLVLDS